MAEEHRIHLIFFRHGIAADRETFVGNDSDRPLTAEGVAKTSKIAEKLAPLYPPSIVITSELVRAKETADLIVEAADQVDKKARRFETSCLNPEGTWSPWVEYLSHKVLPQVEAEDGEDSNIYLTGHEPNISEFFARYIRAAEDSITFKKAGVGIIRLESADKGRMLALLTPKLVLNL